MNKLSQSNSKPQPCITSPVMLKHKNNEEVKIHFLKPFKAGPRFKKVKIITKSSQKIKQKIVFVFWFE
jgi:hypothetical protein